ncbi:MULTISPECIES: DUF3099 domain-containing protein [unclassified Streptomyces]|uniref:DUF3099 domain-containing protein n=1 Tax=unclassified Streptomyces TaxID=2593676 RepID=UPI0022B63680|nr:MULTISPECIES: DUF3099 domain-containing protein [unclassified Streptomyces]MCZ7413557.1 DUF3099 domain-containing protein [Streptomyces sp. WMMC897]MCZ7430552.1 DUF3099 domain-containing protein [Streptomyces sp. WMMC1477]
MRLRQHGSEVYRITGARQGLTDDVRARQRRYVISMLVRTASVLLTVLLWNVSRPLAVVTLVLGAALPYVAVVIANAGRENAPGLPGTLVLPPTRQALEPSATQTAKERADATGVGPWTAEGAAPPGEPSGGPPDAGREGRPGPVDGPQGGRERGGEGRGR